MQSEQVAPMNGRAVAPIGPVGARSELDRLRLACRRQAHVIEMLSAAVSTLRGGAAALRAENAELRAAHARVCGGVVPGGRGAGGAALGVSLPLDARAPGAARCVVEGLRGRVPASVLQDALLVVSELVSNSVRHSGAPVGGVVIVRVQLTGTMVCLEVADPGGGGVIAPRIPDVECGGGFGLNLVRALSERWGLERVLTGGTRVWAQLPRAPLTAPAAASAEEFGFAGGGSFEPERQAAGSRRPRAGRSPAGGSL